MIKNTPLEYVNDKINEYLEEKARKNNYINDKQKEINRFNEIIKIIDIRLSELRVIREILEKEGNNNESIN